MVGKWFRKSINKWELEGTNYSIVKESYNGEMAFMVKNFNTYEGIGGNLREAKQIVKYLQGEK